ncbi:MAG: AraC family transcriptional regulator [Longimicrobiales bacterium]
MSAGPRAGLYLFRPPYQACEPIDLDWRPDALLPGAAIAWFMAPVARVWAELDWLRDRPASLPFFVVLPEPEDIAPLAPILRAIPDLAPRGVLPVAGPGTESALRTLLGAAPPSLPEAATGHLDRLGVVNDHETYARVTTIFASAPHVSSIEQLARNLCQSRRSVGRFFRERDLPVPSHWLQFARLLHVAVHLQNTTATINRVSGRFGYPDGFTMSNSMKRLLGYRPSFVREHLGWEWLIQAWVEEEGLGSSDA